jgi:hypothetical protein
MLEIYDLVQFLFFLIEGVLILSLILIGIFYRQEKIKIEREEAQHLQDLSYIFERWFKDGEIEKLERQLEIYEYHRDHISVDNLQKNMWQIKINLIKKFIR